MSRESGKTPGYGGAHIKRYLLHPVPPPALNKLWPTLEQGFEETLLAGFRAQDLKRLILDGDYQLWIIIDIQGRENVGALTTKVEQSQDGSIRLNINHGYLSNVGLTDEILSDGLRQFMVWAKMNEASRLRVEGRRGWVRQLKTFGFSEEHVILERGIDHGG